jgi:acetylornithine deacetylase/succinyl-diaminopimelate desuccinylase-like protein
MALTGSGTVADRLWVRPAVTVLGIDCPPVVGSAAIAPASVRARVSLRVPPGTDAHAAREALEAHLRKAAPWNAVVTIEDESLGAPFRAATGGKVYAALDRAARDVYGKPLSFLGRGGSIPLWNVLAATYPDAEIVQAARPLAARYEAAAAGTSHTLPARPVSWRGGLWPRGSELAT